MQVILRCLPWLFLLTGSELVAQSGVLWYADPDKSVTQNFRRFDDDNPSPTSGCSDNASNQGTATTAYDPTYGKHWRITKPATRKRAEFARMGSSSNPVVPRQGQTLYLGWRWRVNSSPDLSNGMAVFQWKSTGSPNLQNYPFNLDYNGSELTLNAYGPKQYNGGSINQWRTRLWSRSVRENQWVTIVIGVHVSTDPNKGYIELWVNGSKQTLSNSLVQQYRARISDDGRRAYHRTFDGSEVYPKWGSYGGGACSYRTVSDFQDMRAATNYTDARPRPASAGRASTAATGTLKDAAGIDFALFPNPATRILSLRNVPPQAREMTVTDLAGRRWLTTPLSAENANLELPVHDLPAGMYLLEIRLDDASAIRRRFLKG